MTYEEARKHYENLTEAGQGRRSLLADLRAMGLTDTQVWAVVNRSPRYFA